MTPDPKAVALLRLDRYQLEGLRQVLATVQRRCRQWDDLTGTFSHDNAAWVSNVHESARTLMDLLDEREGVTAPIKVRS